MHLRRFSADFATAAGCSGIWVARVPFKLGTAAGSWSRGYLFLRFYDSQRILSHNFPSPFRRVSVTRACLTAGLSLRACANPP